MNLDNVEKILTELDAKHELSKQLLTVIHHIERLSDNEKILLQRVERLEQLAQDNFKELTRRKTIEEAEARLKAKAAGLIKFIVSLGVIQFIVSMIERVKGP